MRFKSKAKLMRVAALAAAMAMIIVPVAPASADGPAAFVIEGSVHLRDGVTTTVSTFCFGGNIVVGAHGTTPATAGTAHAGGSYASSLLTGTADGTLAVHAAGGNGEADFAWQRIGVVAVLTFTPLGVGVAALVFPAETHVLEGDACNTHSGDVHAHNALASHHFLVGAGVLTAHNPH